MAAPATEGATETRIDPSPPEYRHTSGHVLSVQAVPKRLAMSLSMIGPGMVASSRSSRGWSERK